MVDDLTQAEVYDLYNRYGGLLDERGRDIIGLFLERMAFPDQPVWSVREEGQDKLYYATLALLGKLRDFAATDTDECAPPEPPRRRRRSREDAAREAVAERREARETWARIVKAATKKGEE
jgi:hypothetical protein